MFRLFSDAAVARKQLAIDVIQEKKSEAVRDKTLTSARLRDSRFFARITSFQGNYLVGTWGRVATCSPLINGPMFGSSPVIHTIINSQNNL